MLDDLESWPDDLRPKVLGNAGLARAIDYILKRWPALERLRRRPLPDQQQPDRERDPADRHRPKEMAVCRIGNGGKCATAIMSLLAAAKANGVDPHVWLKDVLTRLPTTNDRDIDSPTSATSATWGRWHRPLAHRNVWWADAYQ